MESERKKEIIRMVAAITMAVGMVAVSETAGEKEVLFPEIVALLTGAWVTAKQPWAVSRMRLVILMTLSSILGVCLVRYVSCPVVIKVVVAYLIAGGSLAIFRCSLAPVISACILPILMGTTSSMYPASVFVMSMTIVAGQALMEQIGIREKMVYEQLKEIGKQETVQWIWQATVIGCVAILSLWIGRVYIIAPPLLVLFTEFCKKESSMRKTSGKIFLLTVLCAATGAGVRYLVCMWMQLPLTVAALIVIVLVYGIFLRGKKMIPPAGALSFLPFLIPKEMLLWYPFQVALGAFLFISAAIYLVAKEEETPLVTE